VTIGEKAGIWQKDRFRMDTAWFAAHFVEIAMLAVLWLIARGVDRIEVTLRV